VKPPKFPGRTEELESVIVARILKNLRKIPRSWWIKTHGAGFGQKGLPDILGCVDGRFFAFEVKRPGKDAAKIQLKKLGEIRSALGHAYVVTSLAEVEVVMMTTSGVRIPSKGKNPEHSVPGVEVRKEGL